ncbi:hypothetical protein P4H71_13065 [Paenibacillus kribbensis]|uniref:hypothetical protein n=1 Tax=Paenibacillus kribbensis TaxID=172713 RepID=UPI002DB72553|nr:hypothetical protein [Paenibacillus kribbensis]MEC0235252.1 hypothetical protein [Paenibacillus kribbensis]
MSHRTDPTLPEKNNKERELQLRGTVDHRGAGKSNELPTFPDEKPGTQAVVSPRSWPQSAPANRSRRADAGIPISLILYLLSTTNTYDPLVRGKERFPTPLR